MIKYFASMSAWQNGNSKAKPVLKIKLNVCRTWTTFQGPEGMSGSFLNESKHLGNLKYKVWEKMQAVAPYSKHLFNVQKEHW